MNEYICKLWQHGGNTNKTSVCNFPTCNSSRYRNRMTCRPTKALLQKQDWNLIKRLNLRSHSLPLYFFGIAGNKETQGPLLHFHVVSRVYQGAVRICRPKMSKQKVISQNLQGFALITASGIRFHNSFGRIAPVYLIKLMKADSTSKSINEHQRVRETTKTKLLLCSKKPTATFPTNLSRCYRRAL